MKAQYGGPYGGAGVFGGPYGAGQYGLGGGFLGGSLYNPAGVYGGVQGYNPGLFGASYLQSMNPYGQFGQFGSGFGYPYGGFGNPQFGGAYGTFPGYGQVGFNARVKK